MKLRMLLLALLLSWATLALAQSQFNGTWTLDQQKSNLTGDTMTISSAGSGTMKFSDSSKTYQFKTDGTPANTPDGSTVTWKESDPNTYQHTDSINGQTVSTSTWKISSDGRTLNIDSHGTKQDGEKWQDSAVYQRIGSGNGLAGKWKSTQVSIGSPNSLTIQQTGSDSMKIDIAAEKASWQGKMDGKDHPATGPTVPKGLTLAITPDSPTSFKMIEKINGKPVDISTYSVSGNTLTVKGTDGQGQEPYTEVYEKKS